MGKGRLNRRPEMGTRVTSPGNRPPPSQSDVWESQKRIGRKRRHETDSTCRSAEVESLRSRCLDDFDDESPFGKGYISSFPSTTMFFRLNFFLNLKPSMSTFNSTSLSSTTMASVFGNRRCTSPAMAWTWIS